MKKIWLGTVFLLSLIVVGGINSAEASEVDSVGSMVETTSSDNPNITTYMWAEQWVSTSRFYSKNANIPGSIYVTWGTQSGRLNIVSKWWNSDTKKMGSWLLRED